MIVYRIEHKEKKIGPYQMAARTIWNGFGRYWNETTCPGPSTDKLGGMVPYEFSGFVSKRQMISWFRLWDIFKLRREGFRVYKFVVEDKYVRQGTKQVAFVRFAAKERREVALRILAIHNAKRYLGGFATR